MYLRMSLSNPRAKFDRPRREIDPFQAEVQYGGLRDSGAANPQKLSRMWFSVDVIRAWMRMPKRGLQTMFSTSHPEEVNRNFDAKNAQPEQPALFAARSITHLNPFSI